jgi:hypothetical protein
VSEREYDASLDLHDSYYAAVAELAGEPLTPSSRRSGHHGGWCAGRQARPLPPAPAAGGFKGV